MSREFKVGDKVVCTRGAGEVTGVSTGNPFPIEVKTEDGTTLRFTSDGRFALTEIYPILFHIEEKPRQWVGKVEKKLTLYAIMKGDRVVCTDDNIQSARAITTKEHRIVELTGKYMTEVE